MVTLLLLTSFRDNWTSSVPATLSTTQIVFQYHRITLLAVYMGGVLIAILSGIVEICALLSNKVGSDFSFSTTLCITRNNILDDSTRGLRLAAAPLSNKLKDMKLQLVMLIDNNVKEGRSAGPGAKQQVEKL